MKDPVEHIGEDFKEDDGDNREGDSAEEISSTDDKYIGITDVM